MQRTAQTVKMKEFKEYECLLNFEGYDTEYIGITFDDSYVLGFKIRSYIKGISKHLHFYTNPSDLIDYFDGKINLYQLGLKSNKYAVNVDLFDKITNIEFLNDETFSLKCLHLKKAYYFIDKPQLYNFIKQIKYE